MAFLLPRFSMASRLSVATPCVLSPARSSGPLHFLVQRRAGGAAAGFARPSASRGSEEAEAGPQAGLRVKAGQEPAAGSNLSLLAHQLQGVAAYLNMQPETFSVGAVAHQLGEGEGWAGRVFQPADSPWCMQF